MKPQESAQAFLALLDIMASLRSPGGCPWDAEQTPESLKPFLLEETHEVIEAIEEGRPAAVCEELGDLMLQVVFQARIHEERGEFDIQDVVEGIAEKLVRRHPHVFADARCNTSEEVSRQWEKIKEEEKSSREATVSVLGQVPATLPALMQAGKLTARASRAGFDWPAVDGVRAKIREELGELEEAMKQEDRRGMEDELGDLLFAVANLGRFLNINPEDALRKTIRRFSSRFAHVERMLSETGRQLQGTPLDELSALWHAAKEKERENRKKD